MRVKCLRDRLGRVEGMLLGQPRSASRELRDRTPPLGARRGPRGAGARAGVRGGVSCEVCECVVAQECGGHIVLCN